MNMFAEFSRKAPNKVFLSIVLGGLSGVCYSLLIPLILSVLKPGDTRLDEIAAAPTRLFSLEIANAPFALIFIAVCVFILVSRTLSQVMLSRVAIDVASQLRTGLYRQIAGAPLSALERIGSARLLTALTTDVPRIVLGARMLPDLLINMVTLIGMLGFLLILNSDVFWFVLGCIAFGVLTYQVPMMIGRHYFIRARRGFDGLQESINGLLRGIKELKLNDGKRQAYFESVLMSYESEMQRNEKAGHTVVRTASNYGDLLSFFVIGSIIFVFVNYRVVSNQELIGVIMALLYVTGPVSIILNYIPQLAISRVSMQRVAKLFRDIPSEDIATQQEAPRPWERVRFEGVRYHYNGTGNGFEVGPLDLEFRKGEITFIVGGNGSGKSTLGKLLTLHYRADSGTIYFGDQAIGNTSIGTYRQAISAIYSDYHLFDQILGVTDEGLAAMVDHYLHALQLDGKVKYEQGKFSTLSLSDGQRRRMALLVAMIDDKQLYLFDEWAADQDPTFKSVFYDEILPALKAKGKAIVVITHDDRYFHLADQLVVLGEGVVTRVDRQYGQAEDRPTPHADAADEPATLKTV
ncbi:cyclic peptide export ABC transporter [Xanthomonas sp. NCPPB 2654]|uniref:cyclic peptide export ABC transporter n=1 Tax=unclassified Xanthomonas TaxID=2643310 RepID=UPI0021E020F1|nr:MULTISPECIES: cyclic peptide export ABC transporter [unclassified Xanthomonas]MDL5364780.1 cyclic peptide export ABC transporter [Xanthomonas sp. NCPPB 2654]UYC18808.1 cyclic peptide export ABC transporter [Xanthomonas sp. CFBP 8443]